MSSTRVKVGRATPKVLPVRWDNQPAIKAVLALRRALKGEIPRHLASDINELLDSPEKLISIESKRDPTPEADELVMCFYPSERLLVVLAALGVGADKLS